MAIQNRACVKQTQISEEDLNKSSDSNWSNDAIVHALEKNMECLTTYFERHLGSKSLIDEKDCLLSCSEIPDIAFNWVISARFSAGNAVSRVSKIISLYQSKKLPFQWLVNPSDTPHDLSKILEDAHLVLIGEDSGMVFDLRTTIHKISSKVEVKRVLTSFQLEEFEQVGIYSGESPLVFQELFRKSSSSTYQEGAPLEMYIGYVDDVAVATGMLFFEAGVAGIYYLATHPNYRRKGYGSTMMHALMARSKELDYPYAILYATEEGKALYKHMGFKECCVFKEYIPKVIQDRASE